MTSGIFFDIIRTPVVTEKATLMAETFNKITIKVQKDADKQFIKEAFEKVFRVKVVKVNTIKVKGKIKRFKGVIGKRADYKKAVLTLEKGATLDILSGV